MTALVFAFVRIAETGWSDRAGLTAFGAAVALLAPFLATRREPGSRSCRFGCSDTATGPSPT
jgi:hypothetical protein